MSAGTKPNLPATLPNLCLGCLKLKVAGEQRCPEKMKEGCNQSYFCQVCKLNTKICKSPTSSNRSFVPETYVGNSAGQPLHDTAGQAALLTKTCIKIGSLGTASLLTSFLTLTNRGNSITVEALWDPESELSFVLADLLPFAVTQLTWRKTTSPPSPPPHCSMELSRKIAQLQSGLAQGAQPCNFRRINPLECQLLMQRLLRTQSL